MIYIIAIEGLDGAGKTYLADKLTNKLSNYYHRYFDVYEQHFPYDDTVKNIANKILSGGIELVFQTHIDLVNVFADDRRRWYVEFAKRQRKKGNDALVIADRYILSNPLHNVPEIINTLWGDKKHSKTSRHAAAEILTSAILSYDNKNPKPIGTIFLNVSHGIRRSRLNSRDNRDAYEAKEAIARQEEYLPSIIASATECGWANNMYTCYTPPNDNEVDDIANWIADSLRKNGLDI